MKSGELARAAGVSKDTVRHYVELGLLKPGREPTNNYQSFDQESVQRLQFIRAARGLGLQLPDIQQIFKDARGGSSPCPLVRDLLRLRLEQTRARIDELTALHDAMASAISEWDTMPDSVPDGHSVCRLIESRLPNASSGIE